MAIPMPDLPGTGLLKGLETGGNLFARLMAPRLQQEELLQKQKQFEEELALRKAAASRASANADLQRAILQQELIKAQHANDPNYKRDQYLALQNMFGGSPQQLASPTELEGQGLGVFSPEGLQDIQDNPVTSTSPSSGLDINALRNNPILRGFFKEQFGFDPLGEQGGQLHGAAQEAYDLERLRQQVGDDSPVYQNAKQSYEASIGAKQDLAAQRARTRAGLKTGEKEFFDETTGQAIGKEIPLTAKERESEEGNILFNELYPHVYKGAAPFSGEGSIGRLEQAARLYKTNPQARQLFDDFLLADKMLAATTVNEASTLKAGRTNRTYNMLKESLDAQDIPNVVKRLIKEFQIPPSAQLKAAMRYQKLLSDARLKARRGTPATQKLFYDPAMQAQQEQRQEEGNVSGSLKVIVIDPNGKRFETTEENAAHLPEGWKRG